MKKILHFGTIYIIALLIGACTPQKSNDQQEDSAETEVVTEEISTPAAEPAGRVFFIEPTGGATVSTPVRIVMGVEGMEIEPAGEVNPGKGHHHVIVNDGFTEKGVVVPADETHVHFGKGQTEADLELEAGEYTLTLQFADGLHQSYGEPWSASINVVVE